jgi:hypothetical protein
LPKLSQLPRRSKTGIDSLPSSIQICRVLIQRILICLLIGRRCETLPKLLQRYACVSRVKVPRCSGLLINRLRPSLQIELIPRSRLRLRESRRLEWIIDEVRISVCRGLPELLIRLFGGLLARPLLILEVYSSLLILEF